MQKLGLSQSLQQKLSPQQIQFIKLLQVPTAELEGRIEEELEINPALEEGEAKNRNRNRRNPKNRQRKVSLRKCRKPPAAMMTMLISRTI